ncbi:hypothetical protein [Bacillus shivajii]|nr:hypothetical protein [Bacillus shivajii]
MKYRLAKIKSNKQSKKQQARKIHYQVYIPEEREAQPKDYEDIDY